MMNLRVYLTPSSAELVTGGVMFLLHRCQSHSSRSTAGLIMIGDEILKAQIKDTNSFYALKLLHRHGVRSRKISVIGDDSQEIAEEIRSFSKMYDYVITSGGIGPTHDDLTYEALALAFDDIQHYHPTLVEIIRKHFGYEDPNSPSYKMAYIPKKASLKFGTNPVTGKKLPYPCVSIRNVYVFPGSPMFFETSFASLCKELFSSNKGFATAEVFLNAREEAFANILTKVAKEHSNVSFGSYPENNRHYKTRISIESENQEETRRAKERFCDLIPRDFLVRYDREPHVNSVEKYHNFLRTTERRAIYESTFQKFVDLYRKPEEVSVYLDGSLDTVITLHFAYTAAALVKSKNAKNLHAISINSKDSRSEKESVLQQIVERYGIELCRFEREDNLFDRMTEYLSGKKVKHLLPGKQVTAAFRSCGLPDGVEVHFPFSDWRDEDALALVNFLSLPYAAA